MGVFCNSASPFSFIGIIHIRGTHSSDECQCALVYTGPAGEVSFGAVYEYGSGLDGRPHYVGSTSSHNGDTFETEDVGEPT